MAQKLRVPLGFVIAAAVFYFAQPSKISILVGLPVALIGALFRALSALALRDLNLTKLESRPLRGRPFEYMFYLDLIGHQTDKNVGNALRHLGEVADFLRVLGTYRAA